VLDVCNTLFCAKVVDPNSAILYGSIDEGPWHVTVVSQSGEDRVDERGLDGGQVFVVDCSGG
jgi:hypothetical protein